VALLSIFVYRSVLLIYQVRRPDRDIGICASDFFCPNLATIASTLGLNENVAGVTFLAFGNGSPDLFSTFSAMRAGSGSLAIGELLGAASFIVSVVAGSMPLVRPFRVNPGSFVRDVGFFTLSVACILVILIDGEIHAWEALAMVGLYLVYVCVVVGGSWIENRRQRLANREALIRGEYADTPTDPAGQNTFEPYRDEGTFHEIIYLNWILISPSCGSNRLFSITHAQCANPGALQPGGPPWSGYTSHPLLAHARATSFAYSARFGLASIISLGFSINFLKIYLSCSPTSFLLASGRTGVPDRG
jgi:sodium/potassium/calcium exchanger 6